MITRIEDLLSKARAERRLLLLLAASAPLLLNCGGSSPTSPRTPDPRVVIDGPSGGTVGLSITFRWHLENAVASDSYQYQVRLDKGVDACDGVIEEARAADTPNCLTVMLSPAIYGNANVEFAVLATDSRGRIFCTRGDPLFVNPDLPPAAPC